MSPLLDEGIGLAPPGAGRAGVTLVLASSPLTRLNYFDGKFLRAEHLRREQEYLRRLVHYANQGLGTGIVYGLSTTLAPGGRLSIGAGLAVDGDGRTLLLPDVEPVEIAALIGSAAARPAAAPSGRSAGFAPCEEVRPPDGPAVRAGTALYLVCVAHVEALCGEEDVFGRLCEQACVSASERPWMVEGVVVRALPLRLETPLATSRAVSLDRRHLRSLVAAAYFEQEWRDAGSLVSGDGIRRRDTWCLGALGTVGACVPLGVLAQRGTETLFFDAWTARRERMESPARRYWAGIMRMRPWDAYLAQILQFQCHLHDVLGGRDEGAADPADPCAEQSGVIRDAERVLTRLEGSYAARVRGLAEAPAEAAGPVEVAALRQRLSATLASLALVPRDRVLVDGGIVELPPAGYLPVVPDTVSVETQVRRLMGGGVDLRFCSVREDFVAHALEEAQHMERISLLAGLDDPAQRPEVDVLVPEGRLVRPEPSALSGYEARLAMSRNAVGGAATAVGSAHGLARGERQAGGARAFYLAAVREAATAAAADDSVSTLRTFARRASADEVRSSERTAARTRERMDDAVREPFASGLAARMAGRVIDLSLRRSAEAGREAAPAAEPAAAAVVTTGRRADAALWVAARTEGDVFAAAAGTSLAASVEYGAVIMSQAGAQVQLTLMQGTLTVGRNTPGTGGSRQVVGRLKGTQTVQQATDGTPAETPAPDAFDYAVELTRTGDDGAGRVLIQVRRAGAAIERAGARFEFDTAWEEAGDKATTSADVVVAASGDTPERRIRVFLLTLARNAESFAEGSALRTATTAGVQLLEDGLVRGKLASDQYADAALRQLFPAPPAPSAATLTATRDWVLFHRRRTKTCGGETPAPAKPVPVRPYALYALAAPSKDHALRYAQLLAREVDRLAAPVARETALRWIGTLRFREGGAELETPDEPRGRWKLVFPEPVGVAFLGGTAGAESPDIARARADATGAALAPLLAPGALPPAAVLPKTPTGLDLHGAQELMLAITYPVETPVRDRVVRIVVTGRREEGRRTPAMDASGAPQPVFWLAVKPDGEPVGDPSATIKAVLTFVERVRRRVDAVALAPAERAQDDPAQERGDRLLRLLRETGGALVEAGVATVGELRGPERGLLAAADGMPGASDVLFVHVPDVR